MDDLEDTAGFYRHFAVHEATGESPTYVAWADGVAADEEVLALLGELPAPRRQPNLLFAAARWHGAPTPSGYDELRSVLSTRWPQVRETMLTRSTQTNEIGRCATMLPVLAGLPGPLALVEVGTSAGLCLYPDRCSYRYTDRRGRELARLDPDSGPSPVLLECRVDGGAPLPTALPEIAWRGGLDLNPLDLADPGTVRWLQMLVWPEHEDRRARLDAAAEMLRDPAARETPVSLVRDDARAVGRLVARARREAPPATVVILHSAVAAYFPPDLRAEWPSLVAGLPARWISQEGAGVLPEVAASAGCAAPGEASFCLGLDGQAVGWVHGHGRSLTWC